MSTEVIDIATARALLAGNKAKRAGKRKKQHALELGLCVVELDSIYLAGVVHPPINEWRCWHWTKYRAEKDKWESWVVLLAHTMRKWPKGSRVEVGVVYEFSDGLAHDPDGYSPKFILDGLVKAGVLPNDSGRVIRPLSIACVDRCKHFGTYVTIRPAR